jgi:hypothetical protein
MQARVFGEWFSQEGDFNPLEGLMNEPKVSLEEAIAASGVDGLDDDVYEAHRFASTTPDDTLDAEEVASAHFYSRQTPFYSSMNKALHSRTRSEAKKFFPYLRLMLGGLFKCPLEYNTLKRGIRDPTDQLHRQVRGQVPFYWWGFTSTSEQLGETDQFLGQNEAMLFVIAGAGVNIQRFSAFPDEKEILLLPGSLLNVESSLTRSGLTIVQLTQQVPPSIFDVVHPMSEILDQSKRHVKTWQRAWGTPKGAVLGAMALVPAVLLGPAIAGAASASAAASGASVAAAAAGAEASGAVMLAATTATISPISASAVYVGTAVSSVANGFAGGLFSAANFAGSGFWAAGTGGFLTGNAAAIASTAGAAATAGTAASAAAATATATAAAASTATAAAGVAGAGTAAGGAVATFGIPKWWGCCGNQNKSSLNCCNCGFEWHRFNRACKPNEFYIKVDKENANASSCLYFTGDRAVDATEAVGKFVFIDKVWEMFSNQTDAEQQSYRAYKALSDEYGNALWQPVIEQKNGKLFYEGRYVITRH